MPKSSRKRKAITESDLFDLNKKIQKLEKIFLRGKRKKQVIVSSSSSASSSPERSRSSSPAASASRARHGRRASKARRLSTPQASPTRSTYHSEEDASNGREIGAQVPLSNEPRAGTSTAPVAAAATPSSAESTAPVAPPTDTSPEDPTELDDDILQILGEDPSIEKPLGKDIRKDIATRLEHVAVNGLTRDALKELLDRYLIPANCTGVDAPALNPEVKPAVTEVTLKRLKAMESKQKQTGAAIAALGETITYLLSKSDKDSAAIKMLMDAARLVCDCQHKESLTRRGFILSSVKKEMREQMKDTKIDKYLFGPNLSETLKTAKTIQKSGAELKPAPVKKPSTKNSNSNLNWKNPPANRRPAGTQRSQAPAAPRSQQGSSSKSSRPRPPATRSRR